VTDLTAIIIKDRAAFDFDKRRGDNAATILLFPGTSIFWSALDRDISFAVK